MTPVRQRVLTVLVHGPLVSVSVFVGGDCSYASVGCFLRAQTAVRESRLTHTLCGGQRTFRHGALVASTPTAREQGHSAKQIIRSISIWPGTDLLVLSHFKMFYDESVSPKILGDRDAKRKQKYARVSVISTPFHNNQSFHNTKPVSLRVAPL